MPLLLLTHSCLSFSQLSLYVGSGFFCNNFFTPFSYLLSFPTPLPPFFPFPCPPPKILTLPHSTENTDVIMLLSTVYKLFKFINLVYKAFHSLVFSPYFIDSSFFVSPFIQPLILILFTSQNDVFF